MDWIFKIDLLSLEWWWGLLAPNILSIFFKNNVMNIRIFEQLDTVFSQGDTYMAAPDQNSREANI